MEVPLKDLEPANNTAILPQRRGQLSKHISFDEKRFFEQKLKI